MTPKYSSSRRYEPGAEVQLGGTTYRAKRQTKPGERPTSSPDVWAVVRTVPLGDVLGNPMMTELR